MTTSFERLEYAKQKVDDEKGAVNSCLEQCDWCGGWHRRYFNEHYAAPLHCPQYKRDIKKMRGYAW
jgi:hypothetical protein